jgi:NitT/TauT family transport system ATP-binding protein
VGAGGVVGGVGGRGGGGMSTLGRGGGGPPPATGSCTVTGSLGYVFQDATLLDWRTVRGNVELSGELSGVGRSERRRLATEAIETVGLSGFEGHHPAALSGGMRMRVSIARALTLDPEVFLFDEPFGALDELTRERLNDELIRLFVARRFAGLFVTHSIYEAVYLASRVIVISPRPGRVVADIAVPFGYPRHAELRFEPAFAQVAGTVHAAMRSSVVDEAA